jgi:hypothetical protein
MEKFYFEDESKTRFPKRKEPSTNHKIEIKRK